MFYVPDIPASTGEASVRAEAAGRPWIPQAGAPSRKPFWRGVDL